MKLFATLLFLLTLHLTGLGQIIEGQIIDSETKEKLSYVNIGVLNSTLGTITNKDGRFRLDCKNVLDSSEIRITMIGYKTKSYSMKDLFQDVSQIELERNVIELQEIVVDCNGVLRKVGTLRASKMAGVCGWGGTKFGKGHELGLAIDLGEKAVKIENLNLKVHKQSFDTSMFRLHLRKIEKELPAQELLTDNIYFVLTGIKGWKKIDLSKYNIVASGKVALSVEWIKVSNVLEENLVKMKGSEQGTPVVLFNTNNKTGCFYIRKGSEAPWIVDKGSSPVCYVIVSE